MAVDPTGSALRRASVYVLRKGAKGYEEVALLRADDRGGFSAKLSDGDYLVLISFPGFKPRALPFAMDKAGSDGEKLRDCIDARRFQLVIWPR